MESLYFVITWACHRSCDHCYEERFHPYYASELQAVAEQSRSNVPRIIENLPSRMTYLDLADPDGAGGFREKRGRIIVAGGEVLLDAIREPVLYPALDQLDARYRDQGGVELIVQTTGDLLTPRIARELLDHHVSLISVSGMDDFHKGVPPLEEKLARMFQELGMQPAGPPPRPDGHRYYHFFGAREDQWIGKLWPRGRAWKNHLSKATLSDNFCNGWSGGLNFLAPRYSGSEVSIDPEGNVFPCCLKTRKPVGNLLERPLDGVLESLAGNPVYEAISMGHPERMGISHGWTVDRFLEASTTRLENGQLYQNLCLGCDRFHEEVLIGKNEALVSVESLVPSR